MKKQFLPYYLSRAILSAVFAILIMGFTWKAALLTILFFSFFLLYLHSGWFTIDSENSLFPLRRDTRGRLVQRKALITAIVIALITYFSLFAISTGLGLTLLPGNIALATAIIAYFATQFVLFSRT